MPISIPAKHLNITNRFHIEEIILEVENESNVRRKRESYKAFEVAEGNQIPHVKAELVKLYPETHGKFRVGDISISKKVASKKNKAYIQSPIRKLKNDTESALLNKTYDEFKFDRSFKEADKIFNQHKYVAAWLTYINPDEMSEELEGKYSLHALAPYEYDIIRDEITGEVLLFILSYAGTNITGGDDGVEQRISESQRDTSAESKTYSIWTKEHFAKIVVKGKSEAGRPNFVFDKMIMNPIRMIPISFLSKDLAVDYPVPSNLANQSIAWNVGFSDLKTASATQGHGQLIISHPESIPMSNVHMGMHTSITLPQSKKSEDKETTAEYISATPDLKGQLDVLKFDLVNILDEEGITTNSAIEGGVNDVKSGFDRLVKNADVGDIITNNQSLYADTLEQDIFKILMAYEDSLNSSRFTSTELEVHFEKPKVLISDAETIANIKSRDELGLMLDHEKHMVMNPNLTDKQAKKREEEIQAQKEEKAKKVQALLGDDTNTEDEENE